MTMLHDRGGRPYLYVANKTAGLKIYEISDLANPILAKHIVLSDLANLDVMSLSQQGNYLFLALGNSFNTTQESGAAIVDVSDPETAFVTDTYSLPGSGGGSGIIVSEGDYAYLGAMGNGILTLNVADKNNIQLVSQFVPPTDFPDPTPDLAKINARGMEVRNDTLFLCYDAGGFRLIDAGNKNQLSEIGRYANPLLDNLPRAYNNLVLDGNLAYITVDYCGLEVIDFSDPANPQLHGWWNPYNCPGNNWFASPSHTNEIRMLKACSQLFISTGKSDLVVLDISNPAQPDSCNYFGGVSNNTGTWGVDLYENKLFLSYVCAFIPFSSLWTGFKSLTFTSCTSSLNEANKEPAIRLYPESGQISLSPLAENDRVECYSLLGQKLPCHTISKTNGTLNLQLDSNPEGPFLLYLNRENYQSSHLLHF